MAQFVQHLRKKENKITRQNIVYLQLPEADPLYREIRSLVSPAYCSNSNDGDQ